MQLTLEKVKFSESLSDDSNAFTADVYIDGVKRATAENHGTGGPTDVRAYGKPRKSPQGDAAYFQESRGNQVFLDQYEAWTKQRPLIETDLKVKGGGNFSYPHSLEADVDLLLQEWLKEHYAKKDAKKAADRLKRMCQKNWVFSLKQHEGQPCDPNTIFTSPRLPSQQLAVVRQQLRTKYGDDFKELLNETYG